MILPQVIANALCAASLIGLVAIGLLLTYQLQRFIFFAYGVVLAFAPYICWTLVKIGFDSLWASACLAILASVILGIVFERVLHRPARGRGMGSFGLLLLSIGCYIVIENLLALVFGNDIKSFQFAWRDTHYEFCGAWISLLQVFTFSATIVVSIILWCSLRFTRIGRQLKAVANDVELARVIGVDIDRIYLWAIMISCGLAGMVGIFTALDVDMTPTMGMRPLMLGLVALIIGGGTVWGAIAGAGLVATALHLGVLYISARWQDGIAFLILLAFLFLRLRWSSKN